MLSFTAAVTSRLVLAAVADVTRPAETAMLGAGDKRAKSEEMAAFRNIKNALTES